MSYRVIAWGPGDVGVSALRCILEHPDLELVGLIVHSEAKVGVDAATLCGLPELTGVLGTNDIQAVLALDADVVCYTAVADRRTREAVTDLARCLRAGRNVVSSSVLSLVYPPAADPDVVLQLTQACEAGGTSCFTSGIDPGFANDVLPFVLSGFCTRVDSVRCMEILNYATYEHPTVLFDFFGFGQPLDHTPPMARPGVVTRAWSGVVHQLAAALGFELDELRETHDRAAAHVTFSIPSGTIAEGTLAGLRFELQGLVQGRPVVVLEHVTRVHDDVAPDWPQPTGPGCYRIVMKGSPTYTLDLQMEEGGNEMAGGVLGTAAHIVNSIPAVCAASPGLLSALDLAPAYARPGLMGRAGAGSRARAQHP